MLKAIRTCVLVLATVALWLPAGRAAALPPASFQANLTYDNVTGNNFAPNATVTAEIDDAPGGNLLFSGSVPTDGAGNFQVFRYPCSSATPPGAGVHGMCGYNAAETALTKR